MEKKTQLYLRDDNKFEFRKLPLAYSCLLEKKGQEIKRAWWHSYSGQYNFSGYKNMSADTVTLGFARDIFLDLHGKIPITDDSTGKPKKENIAAWIAKIATNQRQIFRAKVQTHNTADIVNFCLIGVIVFMVLGWIIRYATGG